MVEESSVPGYSLVPLDSHHLRPVLVGHYECVWLEPRFAFVAEFIVAFFVQRSFVTDLDIWVTSLRLSTATKLHLEDVDLGLRLSRNCQLFE